MKIRFLFTNLIAVLALLPLFTLTARGEHEQEHRGVQHVQHPNVNPRNENYHPAATTRAYNRGLEQGAVEGGVGGVVGGVGVDEALTQPVIVVPATQPTVVLPPGQSLPPGTYQK